MNMDWENDLEENELLHFFVTDMEDGLDNTEFLRNNLRDRIIYFTKYVRDLHKGGYSYLEAIVDFCDKHDMDYDDCNKYVSPDLKGDIYLEAIKNNQIVNADIGDLTL